ncbi:hypothetical protein [Congregicoccus parvus]|uniref:hypothetical protein n=1 Tax=Congregicoccus parvus TaxID=3081749 RepID=UPI003FA5C84D
MNTMKFPFEAGREDVLSRPEAFVDAVFSSLVSEFLILPKGSGFLDYPTFAAGYEALKQASAGFTQLDADSVLAATLKTPVILLVLRSILGFTPPEWAYLASNRKQLTIPQGAARTLDREVRMRPMRTLSPSETTRLRLQALVETACELISEGCPRVADDKLHRLQKADGLDGLDSVRQLGDLGVPYAMLLYERFLGRPFAGHRDSVSELVGDGLESAIEETLTLAGITFRKTRRAERIPGFDQAPDFIVPDEFNPRIIIEAKLTEDDGTARDKATRVLRLCSMAEQRRQAGQATYQVIACLAGRGFGVRREDMRQMILHTGGMIFTPRTLHRMVECSDLAAYRTKKFE